jgi:hypothetical protein
MTGFAPELGDKSRNAARCPGKLLTAGFASGLVEGSAIDLAVDLVLGGTDLRIVVRDGCSVGIDKMKWETRLALPVGVLLGVVPLSAVPMLDLESGFAVGAVPTFADAAPTDWLGRCGAELAIDEASVAPNVGDAPGDGSAAD